MATLLLCACAFVGVGVFFSHQISRTLYEQRVNQLQSEASHALTQVDQTFLNSSASDRASVTQQVTDSLSLLQRSGAEQGHSYVMEPLSSQNVWVQTRYSDNITPNVIPENLREAVKSGNGQYYQAISVVRDGQHVPAIAFAQKLRLPPNNDYALYLVYPMDEIQSTLDAIHRVLWGAGILMMGVVGVIAWTVTKSVVGPVSHAAAVSERLARGQLEERITVRGEDEIATLGKSFNHMASTVQSQIEELATLSQMQQRFVSDVSHELRTPLTTVRMAAEVLHASKDSFDPVNARSAELLRDQVLRFERLLADLLEVSRYDAGAAVLDLDQTDLVAVVNRVIEAAEPLAQDQGSSVEILSEADDAVVEADPRRIERIVRNFVVNAIEHGEGRPIEIHVRDDADSVAVAVRDFGIGMSVDDGRHVFDRFWRADPARARKTGGSGLGLSIAMEDARLHGGWLSAWGKPGEGSAFLLVLPRTPKGRANISPIDLPPGSGRIVRAPAGATAQGEDCHEKE